MGAPTPKPLSPKGQRIWRGGRRVGRGPGTVCALLSRYGRCEIFGPKPGAAPVGSRERLGGLSLQPGVGAPKLAVPTSPVPVRQQVPVSRPATGGASRNAPDPGVSPRAVPLDRPLSLRRCLDPQPLSCDGDGASVRAPGSRSGRTVRETGGTLKGRGNWGAGFIFRAVSPAVLLPQGEKGEERPCSPPTGGPVAGRWRTGGGRVAWRDGSVLRFLGRIW